MFEFFANVERENKEVLFIFDDFYLMVALTFFSSPSSQQVALCVNSFS